MDKIIKEFFKSDKDEAEFFGVSRDNSITLEEYQARMKDLDYQFQNMAKFEIFSIKRKCAWVDEVWFSGKQNYKGKYLIKEIGIFAKDGSEIYTHLNKEKGEYGCNLEGLPLIFLLHKGIRTDLKRLQEFYKIQEELKEIESIGKDVYNGKLYDKKSVSDNFKATYRPDAGLYLFDSNLDNVTAYLKENRKNYDKPLVKDKDKGKLLRKVLIKND